VGDPRLAGLESGFVVAVGAHLAVDLSRAAVQQQRTGRSTSGLELQHAHLNGMAVDPSAVRAFEVRED